MKKLKINKIIRIVGIAFFSALLLSSSSYLFYRTKKPITKKEKVTIYNYKATSDAQYKVALKPNIIYGAKIMDEGKVYIGEIIDNILAKFVYNFEGSSKTKIQGEYNVIASVEGYVAENEKTKIVWNKNYVLLPTEKFQVESNFYKVEKNININIDNFNALVAKVYETTKVGVPTRVVVYMNVNLRTEAEGQPIESKMSPSIIIPLATNYFEIAKNIPEEQKGDITREQTIRIEFNKKYKLLLQISIAFSTIMIILLLILTEGVEKDAHTKAVNKILKNHGNRIVAVEGDVQSSQSIVKVKTIEDLIKIADEIERPIMYKFHKETKKINEFFVSDDKVMYVFVLKDYVKNEEKENSRKVKVKQTKTKEKTV